MKRLFLLLALLCTALAGRANNVRVTGVTTTVSGGITTANFNLSWENSWRGGPANNYDAVWVFIKYYADNSIWMPLKMTGANVTAPGGLTVDIASDKAGAFVYRSADGAGNIASTTVSIGVEQKSGAYDVKVFALEMVYIPQGSFWVGNGYIAGLNGITYGDGVSHEPVLISSIYPPTMGTAAGQLNDTRGNGTLDNAFPTGYNAYYMMKYELSQAGYRDFLNSLNNYSYSFIPERADLQPDANLNFTIGAKLFSAGVRSNLEIKSNSLTTGFVGADANNNNTCDEATDGEWTACGSLYWSDAAAFLDWACLRPMTELEYEKAANGPDIAPYPQFATGTFIFPPAGAITNANTSAESEVRTTVTNYINAAETNLLIPLRSGYAADATSDRKASGGSYYGIMDLSGNLWEPCVTTSNAAGRSFKGNVGDGLVSMFNGRANQNSWPGTGAQNDITMANTSGEIAKLDMAGIKMKGGSFVENYQAAITSVLQTITYPVTRLGVRNYGCRGVRQP